MKYQTIKNQIYVTVVDEKTSEENCFYHCEAEMDSGIEDAKQAYEMAMEVADLTGLNIQPNDTIIIEIKSTNLGYRTLFELSFIAGYFEYAFATPTDWSATDDPDLMLAAETPEVEDDEKSRIYELLHDLRVKRENGTITSFIERLTK